MYLKIMHENDSYTLHECKSVQFYRSQSDTGATVFNPHSVNSNSPVMPFAMLDHDGENGKIVPVSGEAYVLNSEGKTVDRFSHWATDPAPPSMRGAGIIGSCG
jgi:hypothetical protein